MTIGLLCVVLARIARALRGAALALLAGLALALAAPRADAAELVLAASNNPGSLPIFVAEREGYFRAEGLDVRLLPCAVGRMCLRKVIDGEAQVGTVADLPIALAGLKRERFGILATINTNRNDTKIVARRAGGIRRAADLEGRRVGTFLGTTADYALEVTVLLDNADPERVRRIDLPPGQGREQLLAGTVDAVALFEPYAGELVRALGGEAVVIANEAAYSQTWNLVVSHGAARPRSEDLAALLRALDRAMRHIAGAPAEAKALLQARLGLDAALVERDWRGLGYELALNQSLLALLESQARWALRLGVLQGSPPNYLGYVDGGALKRVRPQAAPILP